MTVHPNGASGYLAGYVWAENIGWIKLGAGTGPYANTTASNYGVNLDAAGNLSGYAWSEVGGWINFHPTHSQVTIDSTTGSFDGYAWNEFSGWIHFKNDSPAYNVRMILPAPTPNGWLAIQVTPASGTWQLTTPAGYTGPTAGTGNLAAVSAVTGAYGIAYGSLAGYVAPSNQSQFVTGGSTTLFAGVYFIVAPAAPTGLTASQGTYSDKVALSWTATQYASGYKVWKNTASDSGTATNIATSTSASYDDTAAAGGTWYYYWVTATNRTGASGFSGVASGYRLDLTMVPLFGDFDNDSKADPAVYQLGTGKWFVRLSSSSYSTAKLNGFGGMGYTAFVADFDGDGKVDLGLHNMDTGNWQVKLSSYSYNTVPVSWGVGPGYLPMTCDFDGDNKADPAIYNTANGNWTIMLSGSSYGIARLIGFGGAGSTPVSGYFDADLLADPAIFGDSTGNWRIKLSGSAYLEAPLPGFGAGAEPLVADFDGDGKVDPAYYKASSRAWYIKMSSSGYGTAVLPNFGGAGYVVGAIDFDGDGKADPALYQDSTRKWFIKLSTMSYTTVPLDSGYTP